MRVATETVASAIMVKLRETNKSRRVRRYERLRLELTVSAVTPGSTPSAAPAARLYGPTPAPGCGEASRD